MLYKNSQENHYTNILGWFGASEASTIKDIPYKYSWLVPSNELYRILTKNLVDDRSAWSRLRKDPSPVVLDSCCIAGSAGDIAEI
jgi:hypothetical protein